MYVYVDIHGEVIRTGDPSPPLWRAGCQISPPEAGQELTIYIDAGGQGALAGVLSESG